MNGSRCLSKTRSAQSWKGEAEKPRMMVKMLFQRYRCWQLDKPVCRL